MFTKSAGTLNTATLSNSSSAAASLSALQAPTSRVMGLSLHPVLGLPPVSVQVAQLRGTKNVFTGLLGDRNWLMVDAQSQKIYFPESLNAPANAGLQCAIRWSELRFTAPGMLALTLPLELIEDAPETWRELSVDGYPIACVDEGDLAAAWLSNFYKHPLRLWKRRSPAMLESARDSDATLVDATPSDVIPSDATGTEVLSWTHDHHATPSNTSLTAACTAQVAAASKLAAAAVIADYAATLQYWLTPQWLTWRLTEEESNSRATAEPCTFICTAAPLFACANRWQPAFPEPAELRVGDLV